MEPEPQRPLGITVLGIVGFAVAGWHLFLAIFALSYASSMVMIAALSGFPPEYAPAYASFQNIGWVLVASAAAVGLLIGSVGLWLMQRWAYWLTVAAAGISLATHVLPGLQGILTGASTLGTLLSTGILVYMFLPNVRRAFFEPPTEVPPIQA
jgi:hypothetical protein